MFLKNFIRFLRASLSRPFFKDVKVTKYEIIIQKKLEEKVKNISQYSKNLTNTHKEFSKKIYKLIMSEKIRYFLNIGLFTKCFLFITDYLFLENFLKFIDKNFFGRKF